MEMLHGGAEGQLGVLYSSSSSENRGNAVKMEASEANLTAVKKLFLRCVYCEPLLRPGAQHFPKT